MSRLPDPTQALPLDERIRLAEQAVIDRDERVHRLSHRLTGRWHGTRMPSVAQGAGAGLLAGLGGWLVRRAFASRTPLRAKSTGQHSPRLDVVLQFLPLLVPMLPATWQRWVKPSRLMLGLTLAAPLLAAWQGRREQARAEAQERALIRQVLAEQREAEREAEARPSPVGAASAAMGSQPGTLAAEAAPTENQDPAPPASWALHPHARPRPAVPL